MERIPGAIVTAAVIIGLALVALGLEVGAALTQICSGGCVVGGH